MTVTANSSPGTDDQSMEFILVLCITYIQFRLELEC